MRTGSALEGGGGIGVVTGDGFEIVSSLRGTPLVEALGGVGDAEFVPGVSD